METTNDKNELQTFFYQEQNVRTVMQAGKALWKLQDVCDTFGIVASSQILDILDDTELHMLNIRNQGSAHYINEHGLYKVILRSNKPEAEKFIRWIIEDVIPNEQKHYPTVTKEKVEKFINDPDNWIMLVNALKNATDQIKYLEEQIKLMAANSKNQKWENE